MKQRYVIVSALRMPHENKPALATLIKFIKDYRPDEVIHLGSTLCAYCASVSTRNRRKEDASATRSNLEPGKYITERLLTPLRSIFSGKILVSSGEIGPLLATIENPAQPQRNDDNHTGENRILHSLKNEFDIKPLPRRYPLTPGWIALTKTNSTSSPSIPGWEAWNIAKRLGVSVLIGNTMHLAIATHTVQKEEQAARSVSGVEVGNLLDLTHPANELYRTRRTQGFAIVEVSGNNVQIEFIQTLSKPHGRVRSVRLVSY